MSSKTLSLEEQRRYARHLSIPEVGIEGQLKLKNAKVLCVGAGGLGSPASLYLAAAGVGTLGLVDFDVIEYSNLHRQILYHPDVVGKPKLEIAAARLREINPALRLKLYETRLTAQNALEILRDYDVIVDGSDNFPARYLVNDACALLKKPDVYASVFRFKGQVCVFHADKGPCYRCLYPVPPAAGAVPSCAEAGVLGVMPGIIGSLQAAEALKLVLRQGEGLTGRLVLFDALKMTFGEIKIAKDPSCPLCGIRPTITELMDYKPFCNAGTEATPLMERPCDIEVEELKKLCDDETAEIIVLDVREPWEWDIAHLQNAKHIPLKELPDRLSDLDAGKEIIVHCKGGGRSAKAAELLRKCGFSKVRNLKGGIKAWSERIDPSLPKY